MFTEGKHEYSLDGNKKDLFCKESDDGADLQGVSSSRLSRAWFGLSDNER